MKFKFETANERWREYKLVRTSDITKELVDAFLSLSQTIVKNMNKKTESEIREDKEKLFNSVTFADLSNSVKNAIWNHALNPNAILGEGERKVRESDPNDPNIIG